MDSRITKSRLSRVLSYDWIKIVAIVVAIAFAWSLAFTMGAPRISVGQKFDLFVYDCDFKKSTSESDMLGDAKNKNVFSYDVLDFGSRTFTEEYFSTLMSAITTTGEGDIMVLSDFESDKTENKSKFRSFIDGYAYCIFDFEELADKAEKYCTLDNLFVSKNGENYVINEDAVENHFKTRMKNDPRFRSEEKISAGVKNEIDRIKSVWNNAQYLKKLLADHPEIFVKYKRYTQSLAVAESDRDKAYYEEYLKNEKEKYYAIDLGKLSGGEKEITSAFVKTVYNDDYSEIISSSANGIVMCVFDYSKMQPDLQYESLAFVNYIVKTYSNFLAEPSGLIA